MTESCDSSKHETIVDGCNGKVKICKCQKTMCFEHGWYVRVDTETGWQEVCYFCEDELRSKETKDSQKEEVKETSIVHVTIRLIWGYTVQIDISPESSIEDLRKRAWEKRKIPEHEAIDYKTYCEASTLCRFNLPLIIADTCSILSTEDHLVEVAQSWTKKTGFNETTLTISNPTLELAKKILTTFLESKEDYTYVYESDSKVRGELHGLCKEKNMACYTIYEGTTRVWTCDFCQTIQDEPEKCFYDEPSDVFFSCCKCHESIGFCSEYESLEEDHKDGRLTVKDFKSTGRMFIKRANVRYKPRLKWDEGFKHNYCGY